MTQAHLSHAIHHMPDGSREHTSCGRVVREEAYRVSSDAGDVTCVQCKDRLRAHDDPEYIPAFIGKAERKVQR